MGGLYKVSCFVGAHSLVVALPGRGTAPLAITST